MTVQQAITQALRLHDAGKLAEAEQLYRLVLAQQPELPVALAGLGSVAHLTGNHEAAVDLIGRAIAKQPGIFAFYDDLAGALEALGRLPEAIDAYRRALTLKPDSVEIWNNLGSALTRAGQPDEAIEACKKAIALNPQLAEPYNNFGNALQAEGLLDDAIEMYRSAIRLRGNFGRALHNLAIALDKCGEIEEAINAYRDAIRAGENSAELHFRLADALRAARRIDEAIEAYRAAIAIQPNSIEAYNNLAACLTSQTKYAQAEAACRQAISLNPQRLDPYINLGNALYQLERLDEAVGAFQQAVRLSPDQPEPYVNLGQALLDQGRITESVDAFRQGLRSSKKFPTVHQSLLLAMHYQPGISPDEIFHEHLQWADIYAKPLAQSISPRRNDRSPDRRLRIGYLSPDFRRHSVPRFIADIFKLHDRNQFEVFGYSTNAGADQVTQSIRASCDHWRVVAGQADQGAARMIGDDAIDILIDLAGHTGGNRLLIFALKPAPIQVTYLGYPNTTGLEAIDYRITDAFADPPGMTEQWHTEKLVRLPRTAWCFARPESNQDVAPPPSVESGHVTFGSYNVLAKVSDESIELWSKILHAVAGSRLILKNKSLGDRVTAARFRDAFVSHGIDAARLDLLGIDSSHATHLAQYGRLDIALDPFPYHGTTTTCEALWMGVPVVTLAGDIHVSRVGVSLLNNVGLGDLVARSADEYVQVAKTLAENPNRLRDLRHSLRGTMEASPLMNSIAFTADLETAYRQMWRQWCGKNA